MSLSELKYFVVAEAGCNHRGDMKLINKMIRGAEHAGADAIKFQYYSAKAIHDAEKKNPHSLYTERTFDAIREAELSLEDLRKVKELCDETGIEFMCTPFMTTTRIMEINPLVKRHKIRERDVPNDKMMRKAVSTGKQVIASVRSFNLDWVNPQLEQIYCIPKYPAFVRDFRDLGQGIVDLAIYDGYSNHIRDVDLVLAVCAAQLYRGYKPWFYLELHYMIEGTNAIDEPVSFTGKEIGGIVKILRRWESLIKEGLIPRNNNPYILL